MVGLHTLKKNPNNKAKRRIGRGGKRGKTSGHGHKGQKQHGRHGIRPEIRDMIKKLPKRRGYGKNRARTVHDSRIAYAPVNLSQLEKAYTAGEMVSPATLVEKGLVENQSGRLPHAKILARGEITKKLTIEGCLLSEAARAAIEKVGGSVVLSKKK